MKALLSKLYYIFFKKSVLLIHYFYNKKSQKYYYYFLSKNGVVFSGTPRFIGLTSTFDTHGLITIENNVVISEKVIFLTHDYSIVNVSKVYLQNNSGYPWIGNIFIGENTFIGIRVIILPGTTIGKNCIIGAGAVVKGTIPDDSIVVGNPSRIVGNTRDWVKKKTRLQEQVPLTCRTEMIKIK
ncbi:MAG: acyltransferase [Bacteroidales bacterium]|nr:acyltransferase [Bacteroidales bacterium]